MQITDWVKIGWHAFKAAKAAGVKTCRAEASLFRNLELIRQSEFFDAEWYLKNNPDVAAAGMDPARHYVLYGVKSRRNPSPYFVNDEYYALHNDVFLSKMNPLVHYELYGKREGRPISYLEVNEPVFPGGTVEGEWRLEKVRRTHGRTAVVASYIGDGRLPDKLIYLLKGLREVVDNIVLVADSPVFEQEIGKLQGLVFHAVFRRHGQYDFGSYRIGYDLALREGLLENGVADELVVMNDSNYGPIYPFQESFSVMDGRECDFWGYTGYNAFGYVHISSYFYLFRRPIIDSGAFGDILSEVQGKVERDKVIVKFEFKLTRRLEKMGYAWSTFVPIGFRPGAPTKNPVTMCGRYRMPLLKVKAVNGDSFEDVGRALDIVRKVNPELSALIVPKKITATHDLISYDEHQASFPEKCKVIAERIRGGGKVRVCFFLTSASMFPARPLFDQMLADDCFDPFVCVIPDMRWGAAQVIESMEKCESEVAFWYGEDKLVRVRPDEDGAWPDILADVDIVCYPSPYELSSFRYNPHYSVGRRFLPICVNYGFYRSVYDRAIMSGQSYAYMWKAFFECEETEAEYRQCSAIGGSNSDLVGYIKMDALADVPVEPHVRKRILVALHHSVEGGTNKMLSLANFIEYAEFFQELPDRYPDVDFVFRPHPFLFKIMARRKEWGEARVTEYVERLKAKANVIWSDGGDYFRKFAESDGCIQDCGSFLVEYLYTGKPCCYMLKSPDDIEAKFAPLGKACLEQCYLAYDTAAIDRFVQEVVIGGNDEKASARRSFAEKIKVNYPHAAEVALRHIKDALT